MTFARSNKGGTPSTDPCHRPAETKHPNSAAAEVPVELRAELRRQLQSRAADQAGLSVCGVVLDHPSSVELLRHAEGEPAAAILGLTLPARFDAVIATAPSVLRDERAHDANHEATNHEATNHEATNHEATNHEATNHEDGVLGVGVTRAGQELCLLLRREQVNEARHPRGWLVDACRRSLDLATAPPASPSVDLALVLWLDRLLVGLAQGTVRTWTDAAARCPLTTYVAAPDPIELGRMLAHSAIPWSGLRSAAASGAQLPVPVSPAHAAWMDCGMFARWVLGFFPDIDELRSDIEFMARTDLGAAIAQVVDSAHGESARRPRQ